MIIFLRTKEMSLVCSKEPTTQDELDGSIGYRTAEIRSHIFDRVIKHWMYRLKQSQQSRYEHLNIGIYNA